MDPPYEKTVGARLSGIFGPLGPAGQGGYITTIDGFVTYKDYAARGYSPWSFRSNDGRIFTNKDTYYDYTSSINKKYQLTQSGEKIQKEKDYKVYKNDASSSLNYLFIYKFPKQL